MQASTYHVYEREQLKPNQYYNRHKASYQNQKTDLCTIRNPEQYSSYLDSRALLHQIERQIKLRSRQTRNEASKSPSKAQSTKHPQSAKNFRSEAFGTRTSESEIQTRVQRTSALSQETRQSTSAQEPHLLRANPHIQISRYSKSKDEAEHAILRVSLRLSTSFQESRTSPEISPAGKYRTQTAEARQSKHLQHVIKHVRSPRTPIQSFQVPVFSILVNRIQNPLTVFAP